MTDTTQRFVLEFGDVRGEVVQMHESYQAIVQQHNYPPHVSKILGEVLVASVLLISTIKLDGELTIQLQGEGVLKLLVVKCTSKLEVRGLAQWQESATPEQFKIALGAGKLIVTVQPQDSARYYQSIIPLEHRNIAEAIESYFVQSEQLITRLWLAVDEQHAAGMLLQLMPGDDTEERAEFWEEVVTFAETLKPRELIHWDGITLVEKLYPGEDARVFEQKPVMFKCNCTVERMQRAILTLGEDESNSLLKKSKEIEVKCEFCNHAYAFDKVDVAHIFANKKDQRLH